MPSTSSSPIRRRTSLIDVVKAWAMDDEKPRRLWPNTNPIETYVPLAPDDSDDLNYDYQFYSPNFMDSRFYREDEENENN